jgi:hypothetical protein
MAGLRRAPRLPNKAKPKVKPVTPLHRRILGRGAAELDTIDDLRLELEKAHNLDLVEYDVYLDCHEALDIREAKAKQDIEKATGRFVKPEKTVHIRVRPVAVKPPKPLKQWQIKLMIVVAVLFLLKISTFKA